MGVVSPEVVDGEAAEVIEPQQLAVARG